MSDKIPGATALHPIEYRGWLIFQDDALKGHTMWCGHHADYNEMDPTDDRIAWVFTEKAAHAFVDEAHERALSTLQSTGDEG